MILPLAPADSLLERIGPAVAQVLARHGVDAQLIEAEATAMAQIAIAKTANRSVVGTMNEFAFEAKVFRDHGGTTDLIELSMRLAETPCGAIKYDSPSRLLRTIVAGSSHGGSKGHAAGAARGRASAIEQDGQRRNAAIDLPLAVTFGLFAPSGSQRPLFSEQIEGGNRGTRPRTDVHAPITRRSE